MLTINFTNYRTTAIANLNDDNFKNSSERIMKLAGILLHRKMVLTDVRNGRYDFRGSPERIFFLREEAEEKFNQSLVSFYKGFLWLNSQCKLTIGKPILNVYVTKDDEETILQVAEDFVSAVASY